MDIELPEPCLVVLVGAAGAGKSTLAARLFAPDLVLSSDGIRPVSTGIHCPPVGDHCLYEATLALESG